MIPLKFATIDDSVSSFREGVQIILEEVQRTIRNASPTADETISYQVPTITLNGRYLVCFAAWKLNIGLYPTHTADEAFEQELAPYKTVQGLTKAPRRPWLRSLPNARHGRRADHRDIAVLALPWRSPTYSVSTPENSTIR